MGVADAFEHCHQMFPDIKIKSNKNSALVIFEVIEVAHADR